MIIGVLSDTHISIKAFKSYGLLEINGEIKSQIIKL